MLSIRINPIYIITILINFKYKLLIEDENCFSSNPYILPYQKSSKKYFAFKGF